MKCTCETKADLKTLRSYSAGEAGGTSEMECPSCKKRFTFVKLLLCEMDKHGKGAYATAQRIRRGELELKPKAQGPTQ